MGAEFHHTGSGYYYDPVKNKIPEYDPRSGEHLWVAIATWKVNPKNFNAGEVFLDRENIIGVMGPGCFFCEEPYTPLLATRRCKGDPPS